VIGKALGVLCPFIVIASFLFTFFCLSSTSSSGCVHRSLDVGHVKAMPTTYNEATVNIEPSRQHRACHPLIVHETSHISALCSVPFRLISRHATDIQQAWIDVSALIDRRLSTGYLNSNVLSADVTASLESKLSVCSNADLYITVLTSGALQTKVPASGSSFPDVVPYMFLIVISEIVKFAYAKTH
jgi:hypothetical protein